MKISHKIQILVKVLFAAVMFALSFYYLRIPLYAIFSEWKDYWKSIFIVTLLLGLILWRMLWLAKDHRRLHWFMAFPGLLLGASFFAGSRWSFEEVSSKDPVSSILWYDDEAEALQVAKDRSYPILIDFWAEWCAACKKMDTTTFSDRIFIEEAKKQNVIYLKFDVTHDTPENTLLLEKYKIQGLPTIVILKPGLDPAIVSGYASAARLLNYFNE
jgi:thiol:disulfide interchange protein DsbD